MFENTNSMPVSGPGRAVAPRLESLEDRTTPAVVSTTSATAALNGLVLGSTALTDRAFLSELGRISAMQLFLAATEANRGSSPQIRSFAEQLVTSELNLVNALIPALGRSGVSVQFTPTDFELVQTLPSLTGSALDNTFLFFNILNGLEAEGLAQAEFGFLGTNATLLTFARSELSLLQNQLQTEFGLLGTNTTFNMFSQIGGFGTTGFGTTGFGMTGFGTTAVGSTFGAGLMFDPFTLSGTTSSVGLNTGTFGAPVVSGAFGTNTTGLMF
jgi:hypothetical protein